MRLCSFVLCTWCPPNVGPYQVWTRCSGLWPYIAVVSRGTLNWQSMRIPVGRGCCFGALHKRSGCAQGVAGSCALGAYPLAWQGKIGAHAAVYCGPVSCLIVMIAPVDSACTCWTCDGVSYVVGKAWGLRGVRGVLTGWASRL